MLWVVGIYRIAILGVEDGRMFVHHMGKMLED